ncbi:rod shape-determining protein MreC [Saliterribacillus persicus]|uniref:Cell shape-determining protein MreC n=1 Tax=Saliterribacillus persicus TaxID=930114 RepID=A0A368XEX8_9BACI|nr:rod shape-determining protein MreC [Saliterribacillus persicus]RCW66405.1 rod shape-determining protein MreC [Saliterribacillus persicus]
MTFFRKKRLFILLISLMILVGLIGFTIRERSELTAVEDFIRDTTGWAQEIITVPVTFTTSVVSNVQEIKNVYRENQILKSRLSEYRKLQYQNQELSRETIELESLLDKTESLSDYTPIQASVIARSKEQWFEQITINRGTQNGVEPNMAVITGEGMIGKVQTASPFTSTVLLLNGFDRSNRISVEVNIEGEDTFPSGFILGYDEESESLLLEMNQRDTNAEEGNFVFSSGLGGIFPKGLEIGEIKEIRSDRYNLTDIAYVEPSADFEVLNHVIVVDRTMPQPQTEEEEENE